MGKNVLALREIRAADLPEVGGKAAGLARLASLGLPVPHAFAVGAAFFEDLRSRFPDEPEPEILALRLPPAMKESLEAAMDGLGNAPRGYAVRSSAAEEDAAGASFAGVHESLLRLRREEVPAALFRCWASAFTARAISYRRKMGLSTEPADIRMGVVVQVMLNPSVAGVLFTRDPGAPGEDLLINAVPGGGEDLVQGKATSASIRVGRDGAASRSGIPRGIPMSERAMAELAGMALQAESEWGVPLDLEWAMEGERVFLLQARPVTAGASLPRSPGEVEDRLPAEDILWTRANLRELLPDLPSVLFISMMERFDWQKCYRRAGIEPPAGTLVRTIEGRPYFNLTLIGVVLARFGFSYARFARAAGHGSDLDGLPGTPDRPLLALLSHPVVHLRLMRRQARAPREALQFFDSVHATVRRMREERPGSTIDARLAEILGEMERYNEDFVAFLMNGFNRASSKMLEVELLFPPGGGLERFINAVASAGGKNVSVRQGVDLLRLARLARNEGRVVQYLLEGKKEFRDYEEELEGTRFLAAFREYLAEYGHRGVQETDPAMPTYLQAPTFLLKAIRVAAGDPLAPDPEAMRRRQVKLASLAWKDLRRSLPWMERLVPLRLLLLRGAIRDLREAMALRERIRFEGMRVNGEFRRFLAEAGSRLCARGLLEEPSDLFLLRIQEIEGVLAEKEDGAGLREAVRLRREARRRQEEIPMPNFLRESEIQGLRERAPIRYREEGTFHGLPVGPGRVEGQVVVLEGPHQVDRIRRGDILVTPTLDPSWIPLLPLASGLVVEMGGTLSHGSIIAREYGLPTVVNLPGITRILRSGDRVLVDGGAGLVRRLEG